MSKITLGSGVIFLAFFGSCQADQDRFVSYPPRFSEIRITDLDGKATTPKVGVPFVATVIESQRGKLLNATRYSWTIEPANSWQHRFLASSVYDHSKIQPSDTITPTEAGEFVLQFQASYNVSGQMKPQTLNGDLKDGTTVSYTLSTLKAIATLRKVIQVW